MYSFPEIVENKPLSSIYRLSSGFEGAIKGANLGYPYSPNIFSIKWGAGHEATNRVSQPSNSS